MKRISVLMTILVLSAFLLAACGGDPAPAEPETVAFTVDGLVELKFDPADITVPAGSNVEITLNSFGLEHNWAVVPAGSDVNDTELVNQAIGGASSGIVAPNESKTFTFSAPDTGDYMIVCTVAGHAVAGMVGVLTVTE